jgi:hypothetical protein
VIFNDGIGGGKIIRPVWFEEFDRPGLDRIKYVQHGTIRKVLQRS